MFQVQASKRCDLGVKLRNELNRILSPEFNLTIDDVAEIINILNIIKVKCARLPEKFRLLVGLLCQVDLSIANIEEHYQQLLIKNRIFHLLRMFPEVAHPLLDAIARATNHGDPLACLPVTIGKIEDEPRQRDPVWSRRLKLPPGQTVKPVTLAVAGTRTVTVPPPRVTLSVASAASSTLYQPVPSSNPKAPSSDPSGSSNPPAEFDLSRRMYDQVPPSFRQCLSSVQRVGGALAPSRLQESPSDIQKRILLQQQRHLRQQLEILQAQRLQQTSCVKSLTFGSPQPPPAGKSSFGKEPSLQVRSPAIIAPADSSLPSVTIPRGCGYQTHAVPPPTTKADDDPHRSSSVAHQVVDLTSPDQPMRASERSAGHHQPPGHTDGQDPLSKASLEVMRSGETNEKPAGAAEGENPEDQEDGLLLSQVGQHCIMVSVLDGNPGDPQGGAAASPGVEAAVPRANRAHGKQRSRRGQGGRGALINVKELCHLRATRQASGRQTPSVSESQPLLDPGPATIISGTFPGPTHHDDQGRRDLIVPSEDQHRPDKHDADRAVCDVNNNDSSNSNNNNNNNKIDSNNNDTWNSIGYQQNSPTRVESNQEPRVGRHQKRAVGPSGGLMQGLTTGEIQCTIGGTVDQLAAGRQPVTSDASEEPLDLSLGRRKAATTLTKGRAEKKDAVCQPLTGAWVPNEAQRRTRQSVGVPPFCLTADPTNPLLQKTAQALHSANTAYLLRRHGLGSDGMASHQSLQSAGAMQTPTFAVANCSRSNVWIDQSAVAVNALSGGRVQNGDSVVGSNQANGRHTVAASKRKRPSAKASGSTKKRH